MTAAIQTQNEAKMPTTAISARLTPKLPYACPYSATHFRKKNAATICTTTAAAVHTAAPGTRSRHLNGRSSSSRGVTRKNANSSTSSTAAAASVNHSGRVEARPRSAMTMTRSASSKTSQAAPRKYFCTPRSGVMENARA
jgi:hypothetical protein